MMPLVKRSWAWIKGKWVSIAIALIGVLLMLFSKFAEWYVEQRWPNHGEWLGYFVEHLGAVLVVGMFIRVAVEEGYQNAFLGSVNELVQQQIRDSIDKTSKEALTPLSSEIKRATSAIEQLATGLTYKIIQNLGESLRKVLEEGVLNSPFVRPEYALHLKLEPFASADGPHPDILEVLVITKYKVKNRSDERASYPVNSWLDDVIRPAGVRESQFTRFSFGHVDTTGKTHFVPAADITALEFDGHIFQDHGKLGLKYEIDDIEKDSTYEVIVEGKQLMRDHDVFVWNLVTLTNQVDITVELAGGFKKNDFDIFPRAMHHAEAQVEINREDPAKITMKLHQVFLPYQGVEVRWSRHMASDSSLADSPQSQSSV
jgi:hypothetical protein